MDKMEGLKCRENDIYIYFFILLRNWFSTYQDPKIKFKKSILRKKIIKTN